MIDIGFLQETDDDDLEVFMCNQINNDKNKGALYTVTINAPLIGFKFKTSQYDYKIEESSFVSLTPILNTCAVH